MKRLNVAVALYHPHVRCAPPGSPSAPMIAGCDAILDQMPTERLNKEFGQKGTPNIDYQLPAAVTDFMFSDKVE
ncbi:MAG: hypothetical protein Q9222_004179 [Ikaeria aurantiellina]